MCFLFSDEMAEFEKLSYGSDGSQAGQDSAVQSGENSVDNGSELCNLPLSSRASSDHLVGHSSDLSSSDIDIEMRTLNLQSPLSQSDPNIYQTSKHSASVSKGEILESLQSRGSRSSLECQDSRSCSQSTQSTSTSAEFCFGNVNSVCDENNLESPEHVIDAQIGDQVYTNTENSKELSTDADLTQERSVEKGGGEPSVHSEYSDTLPPANLPTPSGAGTENWDAECSNKAGSSRAFEDSGPLREPEVTRRYFRAEYIKSEDGLQKSEYSMILQ